VYTNAPLHYARAVLKLLRVDDLFDDVFTIEHSRYRPKPQLAGFRRLLQKHRLRAAQCVMVEDSAENLQTAKRLGMRTVWVSDALRRAELCRCEDTPCAGTAACGSQTLEGNHGKQTAGRKKITDPANRGRNAGAAQSEKITTAALAARLDLSEAALYRHFASKAQMFEGLIEFIEQTVFGLINKITTEETDGLKQVEGIVAMLLGFAQKNRGMTRVLIGDALVNEDARLQLRINQFLDRVETTLKQSLRIAATQGSVGADDDAGAHANLLVCYVVGRWHQYGKSGYERDPMAQWPQQWRIMK